MIYCKFWELDKDHDLLIDKSDVARHNDHGELTAGRLARSVCVSQYCPCLCNVCAATGARLD